MKETSARAKAGNAQQASNTVSVRGSQQGGQKEPRDPPQTPLGRLPLAELIASGEDFNQNLNLTPVERVLWDASARDSEKGSSQDSPALPKNKKRAHSSSPNSSSQKKYRTSDYFAAGEKSADLHPLRTALKTPQGDPASELWKKYTLNAHGDDKLSPTRIFGQPFSQLMNSSSPQTPAYKLLGRESVGLRRSFSCGTEWPTSAAKRRKLQPTNNNEESPTGRDITADGPPKSQKAKSRLSMLVAKLSGELARPADNTKDDAPTSSSNEDQIPTDPSQPLEARLTADQDDARHDESPASDKTITAHEDNAGSDSPTGTPLHVTRTGKEVDELSDDFGDDDIDLETFDEVDAQVEHSVSQVGVGISNDINTSIAVPSMPEAKATGTVTDLRNQRAGPMTSLKVHPTALASKAEPPAIDTEDLDEFDVDDDEFSTEDLEDVVAIYEQATNLHVEQHGPPSGPADGPASQKPSTVYGSSPQDLQLGLVAEEPDPEDPTALSEDEFGGESDLDEMVAECDKATQGHAPASQLPTTVCIRSFDSSI